MRDEAAQAVETGAEWLDPMVGRIIARAGATIGLLYLLEPDKQVLRLTTVLGVSPDIAAPWKRVPVGAPAPATDALREHHLVWIRSHTELARRYPRTALILPYQFALVAAPITWGDTDWGALVLVLPPFHPPHLSRQERRRLETACRRLGRYLQEAADSGRPVRPALEPRLISPPPSRRPDPGEPVLALEFTERLPEGCCSLDLEGRIVFLTTRAAELLGRPRAELLGRLPWEALPWLYDPVYEDRYRSALVSRRPSRFTARRPPDQWLTFDMWPDGSGISVRITPTDMTGAIEDQTGRPEAAPSSPIRAGVLYQVMHLAATLTEAVGVQDVVDLVADQIMPAFDAQGLALFRADNGRLRIIGHRGYGPEMPELFDAVFYRHPRPTPVERALVSGIPSFITSPEEMERIYPGLSAISGKSAWAFLPLVASGRPVGCCLLSYDRPHPFPVEERAILTSLAGLITQALERAQLYDAKHQLAHGLQASLLPAELPGLPGLEVAARYRPATRGLDIGGDFYDLIRLNSATAAAVIGDVQGHNVTAAALMGQVRTAVHAHSAAGAAPGEVLAHTNRLLTDLNPGLFTSCLYAQIDLESRKVCLASAGHPPPLLRRPDGDTEVLPVEPGLLLGIEPGGDYPTVELPFPDGSVLALYTDGLVESPDIGLDDAIVELAKTLSRAGRQPIESLADVLLRHNLQNDSVSDDIALLLLSPYGRGTG
ncbi:SpoIIE family protein phosphatase [Thermomonospora cellulosilytica]|uniref:protein-serine/threonine phosphatase n=1 Tax=Thermomonospora cellulosilytica TaxID=1411118 RepID=A0A7W3RAG8_9ACTN|nr:SpoIIE family protein phosphatase [Thermomonospora cellulosilytica]MBA9006373.1 serine phosphatase RsbU (regulator of sigma subunit)/PAS domain-containing protein [Thermomonospora cellulosilytica]